MAAAHRPRTVSANHRHARVTAHIECTGHNRSRREAMPVHSCHRAEQSTMYAQRRPPTCDSLLIWSGARLALTHFPPALHTPREQRAIGRSVMMYLPKKVSRCFGRREAPAIAATFALSSSPSWLSRFLLRRVERRERRWGCVFSGAASAAPAASRDALTWYTWRRIQAHVARQHTIPSAPTAIAARGYATTNQVVREGRTEPCGGRPLHDSTGLALRQPCTLCLVPPYE